MLCFQCNTDSPEGSKYCIKCNALIPTAAPTGNPASSNLDIDEMVDYPVPESHYQSPLLQNLAWSIHEFIEENGEFEPIVELYEAFREVFEGFRLEIPKLQEMCYTQQSFLEDDPMPSQIKYMVNKAETLFAEGEAFFEGFFDKLEEIEVQAEESAAESSDLSENSSDDEDSDEQVGANDDDSLASADVEEYPDVQPLIDGTKKWLECNDSVCIAFDFLVGRGKAFDELLEEMDEIIEEKKLEEAKSGSSEPAAPVIPADSIDLG